MATGDDAAAAGMDLVASTGKVRDGWTEHNKTRDYVAQRTAAVQPIAKGGTGANTASAARSALGITPAAIGAAADGIGTGLSFSSPGFNRLSYAAPGVSGGTEIAMLYQVSGKVDRSGDTITGPLRNPYARANGVSSWAALGVDPSGLLGFQLSARKFKKNIKNWSPDKQAILAMRLVEFQYKVAYDQSGDVDHGLIADELHELGLNWLVAYDENGDPMTVRYERIGLALLSVIQDHEERLNNLEAQQ